MKILILATPRSGSTNLAWAIGRILKYKIYQEPFNYGHPSAASQTYPNVLPNNVVVKTMFSQTPKNFQQSSRNFYIEELKKYDKVILLSRLDIKASYESFNYRFKRDQKGDWHTKYMYKETQRNIKLYSKFLQWGSELLEFSKQSNIPITWYEDLYSSNTTLIKQTFTNWGIPISDKELDTYFNIENKYRKTFKNKTLL